MRPFAALLPLLLAGTAWADDSKSSTPAKSTPDFTQSTHLENLIGEVVKVSETSITLKVPEVVQTGVTRRQVSGHTVTAPKLGTKMVEQTFTLADKVTVRTVSGKAAELSAVTKGEAVEVHLYTVKSGNVGEKLESHIVVKKIDVPDAPPSKK